MIIEHLLSLQPLRAWRFVPPQAFVGPQELLLMPPGQVVLTVNASLAIEKGVNNRLPFELLFDSTAQALPVGARSSLVGIRQVLYRIGSVYIDMEFDQQGNSPRWALVGQMLDSARPGRPLTKVPISLLERGRNVLRTQSNDNGEFRLEFGSSSDLKLELWIDRRHPVHLPVTIAQMEANALPNGKKRKASAGVGDSASSEPT